MKLIARSPLLTSLLAFLLIGLTCGTASGVNAATATVALLPGKLAVTDAPATLTYAATTTTNDTRTYATAFSVSVTDATGSLAGWHIQAALGPLLSAAGTTAVARTSMITGASVSTLTGRAPASTLAYPRPFHNEGETIFSAANRSGMGKSSVTFGAEMSIPTEIADSDQYTATLIMTIASGP